MVEVTPNKQLGQHWLTDITALQTIVGLANLSPDDTVLEVGPGLGTLTKELLLTGVPVIAVEFDPALAERLQHQFSTAKLTVLQHDILSFNLNILPKGYIVVANIPYYLTSKLIRLFCESLNPPKKAVLLVQKEVAERVAAAPGNMSLLSISAQVFNEVESGPIIRAGLFTPPPKVDSQIIVLKRRNDPLVPVSMQKSFFMVVKAGFSERRKKLRSSLSGGLHIDKQQADELLVQAMISPSARAQELTIDSWLQLTKAWQEYQY